MPEDLSEKPTWKEKLHTVIFGTDTFWGKTFDVILLLCILLSIVVVMLESVSSIKAEYGELLYIIEWIFTILFTAEYIARIIAVHKTRSYVFSFFGIIDLLSIIPTYLSLIFAGAHSLLVLRSIRLLRVFRVLKMVRFLGEASQLSAALKASRPKIIVFIGGVFTLVVILGTLMYMIEGAQYGFTSIPRSIYWAVVTLTTVGYGDIAPSTTMGQALATIIMILGYGIIAVPTGIVTSEMNNKRKEASPTLALRCQKCGNTHHDDDAIYCKNCGDQIRDVIVDQ